MIEAGRNALRRHRGRMIRFGVVGVSCTVTDFALFAALVAAGLSPAPANVASFFAANLQGYVLNGFVTFRREGARASLSVPGYLRFLSAYLVTLVLSTGVVVALADPLGPLVAKAVAIPFAAGLNYVASALFVFRRGEGDGTGSESG